MDLKLKHYLNDWLLSDPILISQSATGAVYRVMRDDQAMVLKVLSEVGKKDERFSAPALKVWNGQGAAQCYKFDSEALLMEELIGPNLYVYSESGQEAQATQVFVEIIKKLQAIPFNDGQAFPSLKDLFQEIKPVAMLGGSLFEKARSFANDLLRSQTRQVLLHGDLHHQNVMKRRTGENVCIDPKGLFGDPSYEIATILKNPWHHPKVSQNTDLLRKRASDFSRQLALPQDSILKFTYVHCYLSAVWALQDQQDPAHPLAVLKILNNLV